MRILSLVPAASEWIVSLGASELLLPASTDLPEAGALRELRPDLLIVDEERAAAARLLVAASAAEGFTPDIVSFAPATFKDVLDRALDLARRIGRLPEAMRLIGGGEARLQALRRRLGVSREGMMAGHRPSRVLVLDSVSPLSVAGLWVPDVIALAGAVPVGNRAGAPSRPASFAEIRAEQPDVIIVADPRGNSPSVRRALAGSELEPVGHGAYGLASGLVRLIDGRRFITQPTYRLYRSVELVAAAAHGESAGVEFSPEEMLALDAVGVA